MISPNNTVSNTQIKPSDKNNLLLDLARELEAYGKRVDATSQVSSKKASYFADDVRRLEQLDLDSQAIINCIISHINFYGKKVCFPSYERISRLTGISYATVKRRMQLLRKGGILPYLNRRKVTNGWRNSNLYYLADFFYDPKNSSFLRTIFRAMWFSLSQIFPQPSKEKTSSSTAQSQLSTVGEPIYLKSAFINNTIRLKKETNYQKEPTTGMRKADFLPKDAFQEEKRRRGVGTHTGDMGNPLASILKSLGQRVVI